MKTLLNYLTVISTSVMMISLFGSMFTYNYELTLIFIYSLAPSFVLMTLTCSYKDGK